MKDTALTCTLPLGPHAPRSALPGGARPVHHRGSRQDPLARPFGAESNFLPTSAVRAG